MLRRICNYPVDFVGVFSADPPEILKFSGEPSRGCPQRSSFQESQKSTFVEFYSESGLLFIGLGWNSPVFFVLSRCTLFNDEGNLRFLIIFPFTLSVTSSLHVNCFFFLVNKDCWMKTKTSLLIGINFSAMYSLSYFFFSPIHSFYDPLIIFLSFCYCIALFH